MPPVGRTPRPDAARKRPVHGLLRGTVLRPMMRPPSAPRLLSPYAGMRISELSALWPVGENCVRLPTMDECRQGWSASSRAMSSSGKVSECIMSKKDRAVVQALLDRHGQTYAAQAGITLRNTPAPLYQLLVLALLLSARIRADTAVAAARALFAAGMRDARRMSEATWQQRVDALGEGGYRRYDERTSTQLGDGAELLLERYKGDLRRLREGTDPKKLLQEIPGIGPTGANIFLREAQAVWPEFSPYLDRKVLDGAERLGLPTSAEKLAALVDDGELPQLGAGLVRTALDKRIAEEVRSAATS